MVELKIQMRDLKDVLYFNRIMNNHPFNSDLSSISKRTVTDAKSLLGTLSMNFRDVLILSLHTDNQELIDDILDALKEFITERV